MKKLQSRLFFSKNNIEFGRSIFETLGVLAIMSVITIGGIKGYEKVTKKTQAQNTAKAIVATVKEIQTRGLYSSGYTVKGPHSDLDVENATSDKKKNLFLVKTRLANKELCEELLAQSNLIDPVATLVNGEPDGECPGEVTFVFNKNTSVASDLILGEGTSTSSYEEPVAGEPCGGDTLLYDEMRCNSAGDCFYCTNGVWVAGNCTCGPLQGTDCSSQPQNSTICQNDYVYRCSDKFWRQIQQCSSDCDSGGKVCKGDTTTPQAENTTCYDGYYVNGDACVQCPAGAALCTDAETATSCESGYYLSSGSCLTCPSNATCAGETEGFECVTGYEPNQASTACAACTTGEECASCDESTPIWDGQTCVSANVCSNYSGTAPSNTTVNGLTYSGGVAGVGTDARTICRCPRHYGMVNNVCTLCSDRGSLTEDACVCDEGWYGDICDSTCAGLSYNGTCYPYDLSETCMHSVKVSSYNADGTWSYAATCDSCGVTTPLLIPAQECDRCSDEREMRYIGGKNWCVLKNCPTGRYRVTDGGCNSCTGTSSYRVEDVSDCDVCEGGRTTLKINNDLYCYLKNCGTNKFHDKKGACNHCSSILSYESTPEFCSECDDTGYPRRMSGNNCIKN